MSGSKEIIETGRAVIGSMWTVFTTGNVSRCSNCGSVTSEPEPQEGKLIGIDRENWGIRYEWAETYRCPCCGVENDNSWIYEPGFGPKLIDPKCEGILKKIVVKKDRVINTNGGAYVNGNLDYDGELIMRDMIVNVNGKQVSKIRTNFS
jgi:hypothetical protein